MIPGLSQQFLPGARLSALEPTARQQACFKCLQLQEQRVTSRIAAPAVTETFTTKAGSFITFDPPGSTFTVPSRFNNAGTIMGDYTDANGVRHGFLRTHDGAFIAFDPPGSTFTQPTDIDPSGNVTGAYSDASGNPHGFLRTARGTFTTFDSPSGFISPSLAIFDGPPPSINPSGRIAGTFLDASSTEPGFLREKDGAFKQIDFPGSVFTEVFEINPAGVIVGDFCDLATCFTGFLLSPEGGFTTIDIPGACFDETSPFGGINPAGAVAGGFVDGLDCDVPHGYLRAPDGTITTFDIPGTSAITLQPQDINPQGAITGYFFDAAFVPHGFLRANSGEITTIDVPDSTGSGAFAIDPANRITGFFSDEAGVFHGFLFIPK